MRILVTNDDGVKSPGIITLAEAFRALGDVTIVAPDGDRSSISHRITFRDAVRVEDVPGRSIPTFACSGTPADCVVLGAYELCGGFPDLLVSGINRGANLGDDINYSGTVAAAIEGTIIGIPSLAVSLAGKWPNFDDLYHWETAGAFALDLAREWRTRLSPTTLLNVNVPNSPPAALAGVRVTRMGRKRYEDRLVRELDTDGSGIYYIMGRFDPREAGMGTDLEAVRDGYVSVTPISIDRTGESALQALRDALEPPVPAET